MLQSLGHGKSGCGGELRRVLLSITPAEDLANGLQVVFLDCSLGGEDKGSSTVGEGRGVGRGNGSLLLEGGADSACLGLVELVRSVISSFRYEDIKTYVLGLVILVDCDRRLATSLRNLNGCDLGGEPASLCRSDRLLVRANAVFVLVFTVEAMVVSTLLALETHMLLLVCVGKTVLEHTIYERLVSEFGASPHVGEVVGSVRHALGAGGDDDVGIAGDDGLRANDQGLDRGGADLVDGGGDGGLGEASANCALAGRVLAEAVLLSVTARIWWTCLTSRRGHCLQKLPGHPPASSRRAQQQLRSCVSQLISINL